MEMRLVNDDNTSTLVTVTSVRNNIIYISDVKESNSSKVIAKITNSEIIFNTSYITITGYVKYENDLYELKSFHLKK